MILEKAIKTIILTYCIDTIFDRINRNFKTVSSNSINIKNFIFIHYSRYLDFIYLRGYDFSFLTFMIYLELNYINLEILECYDIYLALWNRKEDDNADGISALLPASNHSFNS